MPVDIAVSSFPLQLEAGDNVEITESGEVITISATGGTGSGTVTSVGVAVPARQSVSGSPVTISGTISISDNTQAANEVFAGPASGSSAAPGFRALTSADLPNGDILNPNKPTGTLAYQKNEYASVASGATLNLLNYSGSDGYVDSLMIAFDPTGGSASSSACLLNIYYDGESTPTVSAQLQQMFMSVYMDSGTGPSFFGNEAVQFNSGGTYFASYVLKLPIPFTNSIRIDLVNQSGVSALLWSVTEYQTGVPNTWANTRKLRVQTFYGASLAANSVNKLADFAGTAGRLVGLYWLEDGFPGSVSPFGAPLEGNFRLYLDAATTTWQATTAYTLGQTIIDPNGNLQTVTTPGTSGASIPASWGRVTGNTTTDGFVVWTATAGDATTAWKASTTFPLGASIVDSNGNLQTVTTAGSTGSTLPTWNATAGGTTTDGGATWTCSTVWKKASVQSSGTEDWFGMGFYFGARNAAQYAGNGGNTSQISGGWGAGDRGITYIGTSAFETQGAYRLHMSDKRVFNSSLAFLWNCGDTTQVSFSGTARVWTTVYFYTET